MRRALSGGVGATGLTLLATAGSVLGATFEAVRSVELQAPNVTIAAASSANELKIRMNYSKAITNRAVELKFYLISYGREVFVNLASDLRPSNLSNLMVRKGTSVRVRNRQLAIANPLAVL